MKWPLKDLISGQPFNWYADQYQAASDFVNFEKNPRFKDHIETILSNKGNVTERACDQFFIDEYLMTNVWDALGFQDLRRSRYLNKFPIINKKIRALLWKQHRTLRDQSDVVHTSSVSGSPVGSPGSTSQSAVGPSSSTQQVMPGSFASPETVLSAPPLLPTLAQQRRGNTIVEATTDGHESQIDSQNLGTMYITLCHSTSRIANQMTRNHSVVPSTIPSDVDKSLDTDYESEEDTPAVKETKRKIQEAQMQLERARQRQRIENARKEELAQSKARRQQEKQRKLDEELAELTAQQFYIEAPNKDGLGQAQTLPRRRRERDLSANPQANNALPPRSMYYQQLDAANPYPQRTGQDNLVSEPAAAIASLQTGHHMHPAQFSPSQSYGENTMLRRDHMQSRAHQYAQGYGQFNASYVNPSQNARVQSPPTQGAYDIGDRILHPQQGQPSTPATYATSVSPAPQGNQATMGQPYDNMDLGMVSLLLV